MDKNITIQSNTILVDHYFPPAILEGIRSGHVGSIHHREFLGRTDNNNNGTEECTVERADFGCYSFFSGPTPSSTLINSIPPGVPSSGRIMVATSNVWQRALAAKFPDGIIGAIFCYRASESTPQLVKAASERSLPPAYSLHVLDSRTDDQPHVLKILHEELSPNALCVFGGSVSHVLRNGGLGMLVRDTVTSMPVALATSYAKTASSVEVSISTHPSCRQKGIATILAARFIQEVYRLGLEPYWSTGKSNLVSQRIASSLGFKQAGACWILRIPPPPASSSKL